MTQANDSIFVRHIPCEGCGSKDNNGLYSDGHTFCFGCGAHAQGEGEIEPRKKMPSTLLPFGEVRGLRARAITDATAQHFGYFITQHKGKPVQVATYYDRDGAPVAQKIRGADKTFSVLGDMKSALPYGSHVWPKGGRKIVVTEGEIDALSMSQVQGNKWPVVSIGCGAGAQIRKYFAERMDYFQGFEEVVLMFDMDEPGQKAAKDAASVLGSRARIASLPQPHKDANAMLLAGLTKELINAMWQAQPHRPEGIVDMATLKEAVKAPPSYGLSWPWEELTRLTYGIPERSIIALGAATGGGKTDFFSQVIMHLVTKHNQACGVFSLEQHVVETATRIAGKFSEKTFHVPDSGWTDEDKDNAWDALMQGGKVFLYDSFGINEWDAVRDKIEYLRHTENVRYFFIDNLTAMAAAEDDERLGLERIMSEMGSLVQKLDITILLVSHLATPEGKPHEEGGRVFVRHFKGSRSIGFWSYLIIGLERDQQAESKDERLTTTVRILKERKTGRGVGEIMYLGYNQETGMLYETLAPGTAEKFGFTDTNKTSDF